MSGPGTSRSMDRFRGDEKQRDIRTSNIVAARAVADSVRTSLGPKGMDKMITTANGETIITNDGATILTKMEVVHPAAKMMCEVSRSQDVEAGDGTTTVVVLTGALLQKAQELLDKGIHPSVISDSYQQAEKQAQKILLDIAIPVDLSQRDQIVKSAITSLNSKVVSSNSSLLAPLAVDAVLRLVDPDSKGNINEAPDLADIKVVKKLGGTVDDTELIDGLIFDSAASHRAGGPSSVTGVKIGLIQFCISAPKTDMENNVIVEDYQAMDRILKEERKYILNIVKKIIKSGCNLLLIQKSILRDAVNDLALHYLAKKKIMVVKDIERTDIEFVAKTLGCVPIAHVDQFTADRLAHADKCEEMSTPSGKIVKVLGVKNPGRTVTVLVRGSNGLVIDEAERSIHDALCVVRSLVKQRYLVPGGGAPEMEICTKLSKHAQSVPGELGYCMAKYAEAFELLPYTLAENAGLPPIKIVTELRKQHNAGITGAGINVKKGKITNITEENVLQPLLVTSSAIKLASETCRALMKIDDIIGVR